MCRGVTRALGLVVIAVAAVGARAERQPEHMIALGWQTEHADVVVIAEPGELAAEGALGTPELSLTVSRRIRGDVLPGDVLAVLQPPRRAGDEAHAPWTKGAPHLVFLREVEAPAHAGRRWLPVSGSYGYRVIEEGSASAEFPWFVERLAATLDEDRRVVKPDALRLLLMRMLRHADDGIALSGTLDLVRHEELHAALADDERLEIIRQFGARRDRVRRVLAAAVAATRHETAAPALVNALLGPSAVHDRGAVGEALRRLADPRSVRLVEARLQGADDEQRAHLLNALGAFGGKAATDVARRSVRDDVAAVRVEAVHALGRVARRARVEEPGEAVAGRTELLELLTHDELTKNELQAAVWCLLQLDDARAVEAVRNLERDDPRPDVRRFAERYLARPRLSLILD